jgi:hypothetical protein
MADQEDSDLDGRDEARPAPLGENFGDLPPRLAPEAATEMFVRELKGALQTYQQDEAAGVACANYAALRLCHALGCLELGEPFHDLVVSLWDLKHGRPASPLFKPTRPPGKEGNHKPTAQWRTVARACGCLHVLIKEAKMSREGAARVVGKALDKRGVSLGQNKTETWQALINSRNTLMEGTPPEIACKQFKETIDDITETLRRNPSFEPKDFVLEVLDSLFELSSKKSELP